MFEKFIEVYGNIRDYSKIPDNELELYRTQLPEDIYSFLKAGAGSYMNGFFWTVNPKEYSEVLDETYIPLKTPSVCFARDAFANLYIWEDESIILLDLNHTRQEVLGRKVSVFLNLKLTDKVFLEKRLPYNLFQNANQKLGALSMDECYGYEPLLGFGGAEKLENLKKVKLKEYISISAQALGKIQ